MKSALIGKPNGNRVQMNKNINNKTSENKGKI